MNIGVPELLLIAVIIFLLFGTKKLRGFGADLGTAIRDFKSAVQSDKADENDKQSITITETESLNQNKKE